jgi:hypothetical protein
MLRLSYLAATTKQQQQCNFNQSDNMTSGKDLTPERYKFLKLRKAELERRLSEKYNQLKIVMNMLSEVRETLNCANMNI